MGKVKIIGLYDTLIEKLSTQETVAVLAHEVGKFRMGVKQTRSKQLRGLQNQNECEAKAKQLAGESANSEWV